MNRPVEELPFTQTENEISSLEKETEDITWVAIPYVGNLSNKIAGVLRRKLKWKITFTPGIKILHLLKSIKDKEGQSQTGTWIRDPLFQTPLIPTFIDT